MLFKYIITMQISSVYQLILLSFYFRDKEGGIYIKSMYVPKTELRIIWVGKWTKAFKHNIQPSQSSKQVDCTRKIMFIIEPEDQVTTYKKKSIAIKDIKILHKFLTQRIKSEKHLNYLRDLFTCSPQSKYSCPMPTLRSCL